MDTMFIFTGMVSNDFDLGFFGDHEIIYRWCAQQEKLNRGIFLMGELPCGVNYHVAGTTICPLYDHWAVIGQS